MRTRWLGVSVSVERRSKTGAVSGRWLDRAHYECRGADLLTDWLRYSGRRILVRLTLYSPAAAAVYAKSRSLRAALLAQRNGAAFGARLIQFCLLRHGVQKAANDGVDLAREYKCLFIAKFLAVFHIDRNDGLSSCGAIGYGWRWPVDAWRSLSKRR